MWRVEYRHPAFPLSANAGQSGWYVTNGRETYWCGTEQDARNLADALNSGAIIKRA